MDRRGRDRSPARIVAQLALRTGATRKGSPYPVLHAAIAKWIVERPRPMTGAELRFIRTQMNMTQRNLAAALGSDEQSVRRWEKARGDAVTNGAADRLVRLMYCDYVGGDGKLRAIIDRLAELDQVEYEDGRFSEDEGHWRVAA
jgi:DNA-binding transcriptional regulator YiaG